MIENLILKAKVELLQDKLPEGLNVIEKAFKLANDKNLSGLVNKIEIEKEKYLSRLSKWVPDSTLREKLEYIDMSEYIRDLNKLNPTKVK